MIEEIDWNYQLNNPTRNLTCTTSQRKKWTKKPQSTKKTGCGDG